MDFFFSILLHFSQDCRPSCLPTPRRDISLQQPLSTETTTKGENRTTIGQINATGKKELWLNAYAFPIIFEASERWKRSEKMEKSIPAAVLSYFPFIISFLRILRYIHTFIYRNISVSVRPVTVYFMYRYIYTESTYYYYIVYCADDKCVENIPKPQRICPSEVICVC